MSSKELRAELAARILNSLLIRNAIQAIDQDQSALIAESRSLAESLLKDLEQSLADRRWNDGTPPEYKFCWVAISCDGKLSSVHGPLEYFASHDEWYPRKQTPALNNSTIFPTPRKPTLSYKEYKGRGCKFWWLPEDRFNSIEQARDAFLDFLLFA